MGVTVPWTQEPSALSCAGGSPSSIVTHSVGDFCCWLVALVPRQQWYCSVMLPGEFPVVLVQCMLTSFGVPVRRPDMGGLSPT